MIAVVLALLASVGNAVGTVFQRRAAVSVPPELAMRFGLILELARRPAWLIGGMSLMAGFLFQAMALDRAGLTLVQPLVVTELPMTLFVAALVFRSRIDRHALAGAVAISAGLATVLLTLAPDEKTGHQPGNVKWIAACVVSVAVGGMLVTTALRTSGAKRAALLGSASGLGFGFTAALMSGALTVTRSDGFLAILGTWQFYLMIVVGAVAFFLVQNAQQSGSLVASQPPVTTCDPLSSIGYGVLLFGENLRGGIWMLPACLGGIVLGIGTVLISHSPLVSGETPAERRMAAERRESVPSAAASVDTSGRPARLEP